ncbi:hypothetical protein ACP70R_029534 [Stipagrostis hirtigluma subsp. patula]
MSMKHPLPRDGDPSPSPPSPPHRRPRGFASATATAPGAGATPPRRRGEREREREKERTKLRERQRRAITSRMLAGLRQHGSFPLPARADMNDVLAALARTVGWTVHPDGTTFRSSPQLLPPPPPQLQGTFHVTSVETPTLTNSLDGYAIGTPLDSQASVLQTDDSLSPSSLDSVVVAEQSIKNDNYGTSSSVNSMSCMDNDQLMRSSAVLPDDYTRTPYIPVYASLPMDIINSHCQLVDPEAVRTELRRLKSLNVDGVVVDCWWGIVEAWTPRKYEWSGYRDLFGIIKEFKLKVQVVLSFHASGDTGSGDLLICLPKWVMEIAQENKDIFFTDREGRRNIECLSWGIDKERVLRGRTGIEVLGLLGVYFDFMRSFNMEFRNLSEEGLISYIEIGLGASGELRYPSFPKRMGWRYPGIGEFQRDGLIGRQCPDLEVAGGHVGRREQPDVRFVPKSILEENDMENKITVRGRSRGRGGQLVTYNHHFKNEIFNAVHDQVIVELNNRFAERSTQLLRCIACLDPRNSFANYDEAKLIELANIYAADFTEYECDRLRDQLQNFILEARADPDFTSCIDLGNLAIKMIQTDRHNHFPLVYRLIELALILPVATATVERAFSAMKIVKTELRNKMANDWLNHRMVCYIERETFSSINDEDILYHFHELHSRLNKLPKRGSNQSASIDEEMLAAVNEEDEEMSE